MLPTVLIVEDDAAQRKMLENLISIHLPAKVVTAESGKKALAFLELSETLPDLALVDLRMPEMDGFTLLRQLEPYRQQMPVIIITAFGDIHSAVQAMKLGAVDFLQKQEAKERILTSARNAIHNCNLRKEIARLNAREMKTALFSDIIGTSAPLKESLAVARKAANSSITVLLKGESGVGKELFARAIHGEGALAEKPFVAVNCGALPENLVESTLFGHEKGAFTGAVNASIGKFREAEGGTLFLDEVSELSFGAQVKLLRALQEKEIEPVGGKKPIRVNVRIIAATNKDLKKMVEDGAFREDLFYRLSAFPLHIPSLRERGSEDILLLANHFLSRYAAEENSPVAGMTSGAERLLCNYPWPGNIRQLDNKLRRAILLSDDTLLDIDEFPDINTTRQAADSALPLPIAKTRISLTALNGDFKKLHEIETEVLRAALVHYRWHISKVSKKLGIGRSTLYRRIEDLGMDIERTTPPHEESSEEIRFSANYMN